MKSVHSGRLERWLGAAKIDETSRFMRNWYGPPIHLLDVPGSVRVCGDGDFIGPFEHGYFASAADSLRDIWRRAGQVRHGQMNAGLTGIADALQRMRYAQRIAVAKNNTSINTAGAASSNWANGGNPGVGLVAGAAAGGTVHTSADAGALPFNNPTSGTTRLTGFDVASPQTANSLLIYDRLFAVAKSMSDITAETVTGVPTRYQSVTATAEDYAGGNFGFIETTTTVLGIAHNWTVCKYTNEAGTTGQTLPSVTGISGCAALRLDQPSNTWFLPLASGDLGIGAWTQLQCDASITGGVNFVIGHPIGFLTTRDPNTNTPIEWLTNRNLAPRVFDNACLSFINATTNTNSTGAVGVVELTNCP